MKQQPRESVIVQNIQRKLAPFALVRKRHGTVHAVKGDPDLYGVLHADHAYWPGRHFELEVKRPGEDPTPLQRTRLAEWEKAGAITAVVVNAQEALNTLRIGDNWSRAEPLLRNGSRVKIEARLSNGYPYCGPAEVIEDSIGHAVKVQVSSLHGRLIPLTVSRAEIKKIICAV